MYSFQRQPLAILYVAYPLLAVSQESAGGAEQMLLTLEREMSSAGHQTTVAACDSSGVSGRLLATGQPAQSQDAYQQREDEHCQRILQYLTRHPYEFDLVHDESGSFFRRASECVVPVLATLHLPRSFYRQEWFQRMPPHLSLNCVSQSQARSFRYLPNVLGIVQNGIDVERFPFQAAKRDYLLWIGRICEEKAPHLAIAAAEHARLPLILTGQVYPFSYHQQYFERQIQPRLGPRVQFVDSPSFQRKLDLLRNARALLLTSTTEETSSLVAMEAMACGTPVIAIRRGAFAEIVADGKTGYLMDSLEEIATVVARLTEVHPVECRSRAERYFSATRMAQEYELLYWHMLTGSHQQRAA